MGSCHALCKHCQSQLCSILPPPPGDQSFFSLFIVWLNLDLRVEMCFWDGLNGCARHGYSLCSVLTSGWLLPSKPRHYTLAAKLCGPRSVKVYWIHCSFSLMPKCCKLSSQLFYLLVLDFCMDGSTELFGYMMVMLNIWVWSTPSYSSQLLCWLLGLYFPSHCL